MPNLSFATLAFCVMFVGGASGSAYPYHSPVSFQCLQRSLYRRRSLCEDRHHAPAHMTYPLNYRLKGGLPLKSQPQDLKSTMALAVQGDDTLDPGQDRWTPLSLQAKILLPLQLVFGIYLLLLLPSGLALNKFCGASVMGSLPYEYITFFSLLLLPRAYKYGKFAKPVTNRESGKGASIQEILLFIASLVGSHWRAASHFASSAYDSMFAPRTFLVLRLFSMALVAASGWYLGKSYDRVMRPDELVQTGPYAIVRHPIYTAYLMLFSSTLLTLRSYGSCAVLLAVALFFYSHRMESEDQILADAFGEDFEQYKEKVPWRLVPFLY